MNHGVVARERPYFFLVEQKENLAFLLVLLCQCLLLDFVSSNIFISVNDSCILTNEGGTTRSDGA
jgi:hypothetical protein